MEILLRWFLGAAWLCLLQRALADKSSFPVYWNAPTHQCAKLGVKFELEKFGITQNADDKFKGEKMTIFWKPGAFPHFDGEDTVNGGIPQRANFSLHEISFRERVLEQMPEDFSGLAVLDFEEYYPSYDMTRKLYKEASKEWVRENYPEYTDEQVNDEAELSFNKTVRPFYEELLYEGQRLRPGALWGYYPYPYCFNSFPDYVGCKPSVHLHNNDMTWLYEASTALFPTVYLTKGEGWSDEARKTYVEGHLDEAKRVRSNTGKNMPIFSYNHFVYRDIKDYLSLVDLTNSLGLTRLYNLEGAVIWGASADVESKEKCLCLHEYVEITLGPYIMFLQNAPFGDIQRAMESEEFVRQAIQEYRV